MEKDTPTTQPQPTAQQQKFMAVVQLIDTIVPRGALRGDELLTIGNLREACVEEFKEFVQKV